MPLSALLPTLTAVPTISCLLLVSRYSPNFSWITLPDTAGVNGCTPATAESVQITATNTTVRDFDINVRLFPSLGLVTLPFHFALGGTGVETQPSLKLVRGAHGCTVKSNGGLIWVKYSSMAGELARVYRANLSNDSIAPTEQIQGRNFILL